MPLSKIDNRFVAVCDRCGAVLGTRSQNPTVVAAAAKKAGWKIYDFGVVTYTCPACQERARKGLLGVIINAVEKMVGGADNRKMLWGYWFGDGADTPMSTKKLSRDDVDFLIGLANPKKDEATGKWYVSDAFRDVVRAKWREAVDSLPWAGSLLAEATRLGGVVKESTELPKEPEMTAAERLRAAQARRRRR